MTKISVETRVRPRVIATVLGVLSLYVYLLTAVYEPLSLPAPQELADGIGLEDDRFFNDDGSVDSNLWIAKSSRYEHHYSNGAERLILFAVIGAAFLCSCFLPERAKRSSLVLWFLVAFLALYGLEATAAFLGAHLLIYAVFHPQGPQRTLASAGIGGLLAIVLTGDLDLVAESKILLAGFGGLGSVIAYEGFLRGWLIRRPRFAETVRGLVIHSPFVFCALGALVNGLEGGEWKLPLGLLLFFWQWERLLVYRADFKDGEVPAELPISSYLSLFLTPAAITNWTYSPYVGQAYSYLERRYECRDRNAIILGGVKLWGIALGYLLVGEGLVRLVVEVAKSQFGLVVYPFTTTLVRNFVDGVPTGTATVLSTTLLYQFRVLVVFGAVTHFRVGAWRVFGYDVDPQYDKPWMATNLVVFWKRFAFHYREFLVRVFYYPVFLRYFKKNRFLRIFVATLIATSIGNHIWGHVPDKLYSRGMTFDNLTYSLRSWPYFLLLGLGISLTQVVLLRKGRTRKPWTPGWRLGLDVCAAYATFQYFALISVFARPPKDGVLWDSVKLFLLGLGIRL